MLPPLPLSGAPQPASGIVWRTAFKYCLISAVVLIVLHAVIRIPALTFLVIPLTGLLAAFLYGRALPVNAWAGARIGAITGLLAFFANLLMAALRFVFDRGAAMEEVKRALKEAAARNPDPQVQTVMEKMMTPEGIAVILTLGVIFMLFMFLILCSIGGAIGGSLAKKHR